MIGCHLIHTIARMSNHRLWSNHSRSDMQPLNRLVDSPPTDATSLPHGADSIPHWIHVIASTCPMQIGTCPHGTKVSAKCAIKCHTAHCLCHARARACVCLCGWCEAPSLWCGCMHTSFHLTIPYSKEYSM